MKNDRFLKPKEISCRVQQVTEKGASLLLYVTSRAGQKLLDEKYGELGWQDRYFAIGEDLYCEISVWDVSKKQWVSKQDVGTASYTEKEKGRASDAFKRACVKHGIARELYSAPFIWIPASECKIKEIKGKEKSKYVIYDKFKVNDITYNADGEIDALEIINQDLTIVFKKYPCGKIDNIKAKVIKSKAEEAKVSEEEICELLKIKDISEMDVNDFKPICNKLEATIEARKGKAK